jgi:hypothetical protein
VVSAGGNGCDDVTSSAATLTVNPDATVQVTGGAITICQGGNATLTASVTNGVGTPTYQWQESSNGMSWTNMTGQTNSSLELTGLTSTTYYRVLVNHPGNGCDAATSEPTLITVVADPTVSVAGVGEVCIGGSVLLTAAATGGTGTCVIQWESSNNGTDFSDLPGQTGPTFQTPALTNGTYYRAKIICSGSGCCN